MDGYQYARSAEAAALHAVIDEDESELRRVLRDMLPGELRQLAQAAQILRQECLDVAAELTA